MTYILFHNVVAAHRSLIGAVIRRRPLNKPANIIQLRIWFQSGLRNDAQRGGNFFIRPRSDVAQPQVTGNNSMASARENTDHAAVMTGDKCPQKGI